MEFLDDTYPSPFILDNIEYLNVDQYIKTLDPSLPLYKRTSQRNMAIELKFTSNKHLLAKLHDIKNKHKLNPVYQSIIKSTLEPIKQNSVIKFDYIIKNLLSIQLSQDYQNLHIKGIDPISIKDAIKDINNTVLLMFNNDFKSNILFYVTKQLEHEAKYTRYINIYPEEYNKKDLQIKRIQSEASYNRNLVSYYVIAPLKSNKKSEIMTFIRSIAKNSDIKYYNIEYLNINPIEHLLTPKIDIVYKYNTGDPKQAINDLDVTKLPTIADSDLLCLAYNLSIGDIIYVYDFSPHFRRII